MYFISPFGMIAVRRKLAFSRTATIPKYNRYEHGSAQRAESANTG